MTEPGTRVASWVGPFVAGATYTDLLSLEQQGANGVRVLTDQELQRDHFKARCDALVLAAREFFFDYDGTSSLIFQKTRDTAKLPDFVEYVYCWLANDRLCGLILSGVTSDAGTHDQMNSQESAFWEHTAEVSEALSQKYNENIDSFVNFFNFETYSQLPDSAEGPAANRFSSYQQLVNVNENNEPAKRLETHYCGPALVRCTRPSPETNLSAPATHSRQATRRYFANPDFFIVYDVKIERYVRTIESIHVFENVIYIARKLAEDLGRELNSRRTAQVRAQAQSEIDEWNEAHRLAVEARKERIRRLAEIL